MYSRRRPRAREVPGTRWPGRLLRGLRPDRNPLRRRSDRVEIAVFGLLLIVFCAGAPVAAHVAGSWTYAVSAREALAQRAALHEVPATLLQAAPAWNGYANSPGAAPQAAARWRAPDGQLRTGNLYIPDGAAAGSTVSVWTNEAGQLADPPLLHTQVINRAQLTAVFAVGGLAVVLLAAGWLARRATDRRRLAAWDADWLATGPRWSPRR